MPPLYTTLVWGMPVSGTLISLHPDESELVLATPDILPSPPPTTSSAFQFADGSHTSSKRISSSRQVSKLWMASNAHEYSWTINIPKALINPPPPSGLGEHLEEILERAHAKTRYGLSALDKQNLVGDLWQLLNEMNWTNAGRNLFWRELLESCMWGALSAQDGDAIGRPSWARVAKPIVEDFFSWFEHLAGSKEEALNILAHVFLIPFKQAHYTTLIAPLRNLQRAFPKLLGNLADELVIKTYTLLFLDADFDFLSKLPEINRLLQERDLGPFNIWEKAYGEAWEQTNKEAILRGEVIFEIEEFGQNPDNEKTRSAVLERHFGNKIWEAIDPKESRATPLVELLSLLSSPEMTTYHSLMEDIFDALFKLKEEDITTVATILVDMKRAASKGEMAPHFFDLYRAKIMSAYETMLAQAIPVQDPVKGDRMERAVRSADVFVKACSYEEGALFQGTAERILREKAKRQIEEMLTEKDTLMAIAGYSLLQKNFAYFSNNWPALFDIHFRKGIQNRVIQILESEKPETLVFALEALEQRVIALQKNLSSSASGIIIEKALAYIRDNLFSGQETATRDRTIRRLFQDGDLGIYLAKSRFPGKPWRNESDDLLREGERYIDTEGLALMEQSFLIAQHLSGEQHFLDALRKTIVYFCSDKSEIAKFMIIVRLRGTTNEALQEAVTRAGFKLGVV